MPNQDPRTGTDARSASIKTAFVNLIQSYLNRDGQSKARFKERKDETL